MRRTAVVFGALVAAIAVVLGGLGAMPRAAAQDGSVPDDRRTVIISVPGLTWEDVDEEDVPNLRALLDDSAVANLALRVERLATPAGEGYATIGAGTRAVAPLELGGLGFRGDEGFGAGTAAEELGRQLGHSPDGDVVHIGWRELERENDGSEFEATLGTLGDALADAGVARGVVGNADGDDLLVDEYRHREAALALADADGVVPCGDVSGDVLAADPMAPFGHRLDHGRVLDVFRRCSVPSSVVLVEASDMRRADAYDDRVAAGRAAAMRSEALRSTDELVGAILDDLDPQRDAVVVLSPSVSSTPRLVVLGVRAAEVEPGLLVSGSTRQDGFVTIADVTPTIAALAGVPLDDDVLEGRAAEVSSTGGSAADRRERLADADAAARFRDRLIGPVAGAYIAAVCLLALASVFVLSRTRRSRALEWVALVLLAVTPMTYLAALVPFHDLGAGAYAAFVAVGAVALGSLYALLGKGWLRPLVAAYGIIIGVIAVSVVLLGSRLQLSTVFGDSPIIAGRFNGVNNVTFAQLMIGAVAIAAVAADRFEHRRARVAVVAVLAAVMLVDVAPMWGADVGGALGGLPALALVGIRLGGWKVRWRTVVLWAVAGVAAVVLLGLIDLTRESADRSHLGRLFERIGSDGIDGLWTVVDRKLGANLRSLRGSIWRFILVPVLFAVVLVAWRAPGRLRDLARAFPAVRQILPGVVLAMVLGYAVNDSGIAVPGMMLAVSVPAVVYLVSRVPDEPTPELALEPSEPSP